MPGTIRYQSDAYDSDATFQDLGQSAFTQVWNAFKWFESVSGGAKCVEVARNNGKTATYTPRTPGTDFYDEANPFGENAWAIFLLPPNAGRPEPLYIRMAWSSGTSAFDDAPNTGAKLYGQTGANTSVGFQMAFALDSNGDPVSPLAVAGTGTMGADAVQSPFWATPAAGAVYVFPMSNNGANTHATVKENHMGLNTSATFTKIRTHVWMDDDSVAIEFNAADGSTLRSGIYMGRYVPIVGSTREIPYYMMGFNGIEMMASDTRIGRDIGQDAREGGITMDKDGSVFELRTQFSPAYMNSISPVNLDVGSRFLAPQVPLCRDTSGQVGWMDPNMFRMTSNRSNRDMDIGNVQKVSSWSSVASDVKLLVKWDGSVVGANYNRQGNRS